VEFPSLLSLITRGFIQFFSNTFNTVQVVLAQGTVILAFFVIGCGYVSTSDYLSHIKSITILPIDIQDPDFYNDTSGNPHDEIIREALINRFNQKWRDGNDAELNMAILDFDLRPIDYNANNQPEKLRMSLEIEYEFKDRLRNKMIDSKDNYFQIHDFYIVSDRGEPPETLEQAQTRLIQELVNDFYSTLAEQW
jgi:hypothetical protein